ncbi:hypothetical protein COU58_02855 [Candidatus Pacearchaeota archaeon CG10_big_fil_rev_8_21_14_0_10_32_42]|nr:MAG: hypothetical protein COU58_02855 [Candidatus Pacearchaeota archaeon CG10_big_fil_rev_8_21_14_0_10_32_42]
MRKVSEKTINSKIAETENSFFREKSGKLDKILEKKRQFPHVGKIPNPILVKKRPNPLMSNFVTDSESIDEVAPICILEFPDFNEREFHLKF